MVKQKVPSKGVTLYVLAPMLSVADVLDGDAASYDAPARSWSLEGPLLASSPYLANRPNLSLLRTDTFFICAPRMSWPHPAKTNLVGLLFVAIIMALLCLSCTFRREFGKCADFLQPFRCLPLSQ